MSLGPDDPASRAVPGDFVRDAAALLESCETGDQEAGLVIMMNADRAQVALFLATECLRLAHKVYGDDLSRWLGLLRKAGDLFDPDAGGG